MNENNLKLLNKNISALHNCSRLETQNSALEKENANLLSKVNLQETIVIKY